MLPEDIVKRSMLMSAVVDKDTPEVSLIRHGRVAMKLTPERIEEIRKKAEYAGSTWGLKPIVFELLAEREEFVKEIERLETHTLVKVLKDRISEYKREIERLEDSNKDLSITREQMLKTVPRLHTRAESAEKKMEAVRGVKRYRIVSQHILPPQSMEEDPGGEWIVANELDAILSKKASE